jgi:hypothetical protein
MSLKRSHTSTRSMPSGGSDGKLGRQELFDELKKHAQSGQVFTPVDISMAIGASEAAVSRTLLGLAAEGYLEKVEVGKYRSTPFQEVPQAEFLKALARASKTDSTRQRDLSEIARLKQNNDVMRAKLLGALAERDHYLAVLKQHGIDPGPVPAPAPAEPPAAAAPAPPAAPAAPVEPPPSAPSPAPVVVATEDSATPPTSDSAPDENQAASDSAGEHSGSPPPSEQSSS